MYNLPVPEVLEIPCADCQKMQYVLWERGVHNSPEYVLVADWIYCSPCFDVMAEEMARLPEPDTSQNKTFEFDPFDCAYIELVTDKD